jgi:predicted transcriptional regulator
MDEKKKILDTMKTIGTAVRPGDIAEKANLDKELVSKHLKEMKESGMIISPKRCFYSLP